jgi:pimeloyl-ACP methyl ester carboxylesterase
MAYAENDGTKIYWEEEGQGEPLLLIMGLGYTLEMWHRVKPLLTDRFQVISFDNRGVGKTDVPSSPYSIGDMASDAAAVLDAAAVDSAHVLGASMGGMIAQELALNHPQRVRSLILGCTACGGPDAVEAEPEVIQALMARADLTPEEGVRVMIPYIYDVNTPEEQIEEDLLIRMRTFPTPEGYLGQIQAIVGHSTFDRLGQIDIPTLVVHGQTDRLVPHANGEVLAAAIPGSRFVSIPDASHIFFTDQPEATRTAITGFLDEVLAGSSTFA